MGSRVEKLVALEIMLCQDKENPTDTYYNDVLAATEEKDIIVSVKALEMALGHYSSEVFPPLQRRLASPQRAIDVIRFLVEQGNQVVRREGPPPNVVAVQVLTVALRLGGMYPTGDVLASLQDAYKDLRKEGHFASASRIGILLAEQGRPPSLDLIREDLNSADPLVVSDAAEVAMVSEDASLIEHLKSSYNKQQSDAGCKETILNAIHHLSPQAAPRVFFELLIREESKSRCDQLVYLLRQSGHSDTAIAAHVRANFSGSDARISLSAARVLIDLGDNQVFAILRSELSRVTAVSHDDLYGKQIVRILGDARDTGSIELLGRLFSQSTDPVMRAYAKRALENLGHPSAIEWLRAGSR
jgi:hypothetical protein